VEAQPIMEERKNLKKMRGARDCRNIICAMKEKVSKSKGEGEKKNSEIPQPPARGDEGGAKKVIFRPGKPPRRRKKTWGGENQKAWTRDAFFKGHCVRKKRPRINCRDAAGYSVKGIQGRGGG